jgi:hypothetical protein
MSDTPNVQLSLAKLRKEVTVAEPLKLALSGSKVITFPDVYAMESVEAEEIFSKLSSNATSWTVIGTWLSEEDAAALKAEKLSIIELSTVIQAAVKYYEDIYGNAGNGSASAGS